MPPDTSWQVEEFKLTPHRIRKDMFHYEKYSTVKRKPKLQEQETEKHTCTSSQTHPTSTHGYCSSISCTQEWYLLTPISDNGTQHHKSHTNISDNGTQPLKGKWIGLQVGEEVCSCGSLVQEQEADSCVLHHKFTTTVKWKVNWCWRLCLFLFRRRLLVYTSAH